MCVTLSIQKIHSKRNKKENEKLIERQRNWTKDFYVIMWHCVLCHVCLRIPSYLYSCFQHMKVDFKFNMNMLLDSMCVRTLELKPKCVCVCMPLLIWEFETFVLFPKVVFHFVPILYFFTYSPLAHVEWRKERKNGKVKTTNWFQSRQNTDFRFWKDFIKNGLQKF